MESMVIITRTHGLLLWFYSQNLQTTVDIILIYCER